MQYIDPFDFFQISPEDLESPQLDAILRKAKQRVLSQFELNEDMPLQYQGQSIDKSMVLQLLDELARPEKRRMFISIQQNQALQQCLSTPSLLAFQNLQASIPIEWMDEALIDHLQNSYAQLLEQFIKLRDWNYVVLQLEIMPWFGGRHSEALAPLVRFASLMMREVESVASKATPFRDTTWQAATDLGFIVAMNQMPQQYQALRNELGDKLDDCARMLAKEKGGYPLAIKTLNAAERLTLDISQKTSLGFARREINAHQPKKWYQHKAFAVVVALLFAGILITGMVLLDANGKKNNREVELYQLIKERGLHRSGFNW
jgi:hypothetical protein